jgi:hypothetical protein
MKETAVDWLLSMLDYNEKMLGIKEIIEQAKEIEKEQVKNAWYNSLTKGDYNSADEYYNQTFKNTDK